MVIFRNVFNLLNILINKKRIFNYNITEFYIIDSVNSKNIQKINESENVLINFFKKMHLFKFMLCIHFCIIKI